MAKVGADVVVERRWWSNKNRSIFLLLRGILSFVYTLLREAQTIYYFTIVLSLCDRKLIRIVAKKFYLLR